MHVVTPHVLHSPGLHQHVTDDNVPRIAGILDIFGISGWTGIFGLSDIRSIPCLPRALSNEAENGDDQSQEQHDDTSWWLRGAAGQDTA